MKTASIRLRPISTDEASRLIEAYLLTRADDLAEQINDLIGGVAVDWDADDLEAELKRAAKVITAALSFESWAGMVAVTEPIIRQAAIDGAITALFQVMPDPAIGMTTNIRSRAVTWARDRSAEMVGMKWIDGKLVQNPAAEWQITEGTREMIRAQVVEAMKDGDSVQELASRLKQSHAFGKARAETIARTETAMADGMGNLIGWEESGLVAGKQWITAEDDKVSETCTANGEMGVIGLHEYFSHGHLTIPGHPNCRCAVVPVIAEDMPSEKFAKAFDPKQPRDKNGRWTAGGIAFSLSGNELGSFEDTKQHRKAAMQYARENFVGKSYVNESSGHEITVTWQGIKHATSKSNAAELTLIPKLDVLLMKADYQGSFPDRKDRPDIVAAHKYYAKVKLNGEVLNIGVITREFKDGHKHYDHFILKDE